jgi:hypothetical protein
LRQLRPPDDLAEAMGPELERCKVLFRRLPEVPAHRIAQARAPLSRATARSLARPDPGLKGIPIP